MQLILESRHNVRKVLNSLQAKCSKYGVNFREAPKLDILRYPSVLYTSIYLIKLVNVINMGTNYWDQIMQPLPEIFGPGPRGKEHLSFFGNIIFL